MHTFEEIKRKEVENIFTKRLNSGVMRLRPVSIAIHESEKSEYTAVSFAFSEKIFETKKSLNFKNLQGRGFIDVVFSTCLEHYSGSYPSLGNIILNNISIKPDFQYARSHAQTDAMACVNLNVGVKDYGTATFRSVSNSLIHSSFDSILSAFEFYINCDAAFNKLKFVVEDAKSRNRADIVSSCVVDLSCLTEMNSYA